MRFLATAASVAARALGATLRLDVVGVESVAPLWTARRPIVYAMWHGRILMAPWVNARLRRTHGARRVTVLASRSSDGELVARYVERFGLSVVRGSSSHGGATALRALIRTLRDGDDVVIIPDGPRGPRGQVQSGVIALAASTGAALVPMAIAARPARTLRSWDRFQIPWPFARIVAAFGAPIVFPADAEQEAARRELTAALDRVTAEADRRAGHPPALATSWSAAGTERSA
ncbi:MAG: lysophospholipid acyltransferase family protein [Candidatus Rokubacteria bacterium]|nr:lysophospholipid acyltransferase family protein [Candidatus Rokubacteria bacterium]